MKFVDWIKGWHLASVAIVVVLAAGTTYWLLDDTKSTKDIESDLVNQLTDQIGEQVTIVSVDCPDSVEWEPGEEFHCFAKTADGTTAQVTVFMENGAGEYTWHLG